MEHSLDKKIHDYSNGIPGVIHVVHGSAQVGRFLLSMMNTKMNKVSINKYETAPSLKIMDVHYLITFFLPL